MSKRPKTPDRVTIFEAEKKTKKKAPEVLKVAKELEQTLKETHHWETSDNGKTRKLVKNGK